ncbi:MAG: hypothetical protein K6F39_04720 [Lachnospiraceae bacterium]|nr:hypothetical protein [Lachnospiraceae bacterium]
MSRFDVKPDGLKGSSETLLDISTQIGRCGTEVLDIANAMRDCTEFVEIKIILNRLSQEITDDAKKTRDMQKALHDIFSLYQTTENKLLDGADLVTEEGKSPEGKDDSSHKSPDWNSLAWDVVSSFGIIGQMTTMIGQGAQGDMKGAAENWAKAMIGLYKCSKDGSSDLFNLSPNDVVKNAGELFDGSIAGGIKNGDLGGNLGKIGGNLYDASKSGLKAAAKEYKLFGEGVDAADSLGASANWATAIIDNGVENYGEYASGQISAGRAVAEAAIETGVDVGMDIGANALIGVAAAALTPAAPAVAVGLAATAAVWGINAGVEYFTGKDCGEWAADFVCDGIEKAGDGLSAAADWAGDKLSDAADSFGDMVSSSPLGSIAKWAGF